MPAIGSFTAYSAQQAFGKKLKEAVRRDYGCTIRLAGRGETIPNSASYVEIDSNVVDRCGIPALRFHYQWSNYEWKQARHMERTYIQIIEQMGGKVLPRPSGGPDASGIILVPGSVQHEVGTARGRYGTNGRRQACVRGQWFLSIPRGQEFVLVRRGGVC